MNTTKKINVNFSSLVGLKAELLRKQTEVQQAKLKTEAAYVPPKLKKKSKKQKEKRTKENVETVTDIDDINAHKKSKLMLEAKARLYDRLKKSKNMNENFLVDFTNKSDESEDEPLEEESYDDTILDNEDGWVEYEDCFGRTRKCLREDLPIMQEKDELIKQQVMKKKEDDLENRDIIKQNPIMEEKEPEIEVMRRKWEEQTEKLADKANIHYQDILFDEARAHGVGYYAFSQDEDQRIKQQENLANLRKQTEQKQKEMKELKELRDRMEQNRLKAARIRQRIRAGLPAEPAEEEIAETKEEVNLNASEDTNELAASNNSSTMESNDKNVTSTEQNTVQDLVAIKENKIKALGELLGKRGVWQEMSQEEWVHKRRKLRIDEFAPAYDNFQRAGYLNLEHHSSPIVPGQMEDSNSSNVEAHEETSHNVHTSLSNLPNQPEQEVLIKNKMNQDVTASNPTSINSATILPESSSDVLTDSYVDTHQSMSNKLAVDLETCRSVHTEYDQSLDISQKSQAEGNTETDIVNTDSSTTVKTSINEENIMAGLRYLREKLESKQNP